MKQVMTTVGQGTTPAYKAPEVLAMGEPTAKVDIWALGIILYQLLTGTHPFMKNDDWQTIIAIKEMPFQELSDEVSVNTKKIVEMLL